VYPTYILIKFSFTCILLYVELSYHKEVKCKYEGKEECPKRVINFAIHSQILKAPFQSKKKPDPINL
jgi:hypothetical protein